MQKQSSLNTGELPSANNQRFITIDQVKEITTLGKTKIYELMSLGLFPQRIKLRSTRRSVWVESEIYRWTELQIKARDHVGVSV